MHKLDEVFIAAHNWRFNRTHNRLRRLLYFAEKVGDGGIKTFNDARQSINQAEYFGGSAIIDMTELILRFNGSYVFEIATGNVGFCCRPISPGDRILLVPGGGNLQATSAEPSHYVGEAYVQGWTEESILELLPEADQGLQVFCVS